MEELIGEKTGILALHFQFLSPVACLNRLIVAIWCNATPLKNARGPYSPYSKLASIILLAVQNVFVGHDPDTFSLVAGFFARAISMIEDVPVEHLNKIAFALFPLIELLSNNFESPTVMGNKEQQSTSICSLLRTVIIVCSLHSSTVFCYHSSTSLHSLHLVQRQSLIQLMTLSQYWLPGN